MALKVTSTIEARNAIVRARAKLEPAKIEPAKPEPVKPEPSSIPLSPSSPSPRPATPYEQALAKGRTAQSAGNWADALAAYEQAAKLNRAPSAVTEVNKARRSLYDAVMASGRAAEQASEWSLALAAYEMAVKVTGTQEARSAAARMKAKLEPPGSARPRPAGSSSG